MPITKYATDFMSYADEDIRTADILLKEDGPANPICFHAQQAAEKYLKAYLASHNRHARKVHDLEMLVSECATVNRSFEELSGVAADFAKFYLESRYLGDIPQFSFDEAQQALDGAKYIKEFVSERIEKVV